MMTDPCVYMKLLNMPTRVKLQGRDPWTGMNDSTRSVALRELRLGIICLGGFTDRQVDNSICTVWASCADSDARCHGLRKRKVIQGSA